MILAGIDVGTLTCRLLVGRVSETGQIEEVHSERRVLRLGEGLDRSGRLAPEAMERVVATLREWQASIRTYGAAATTVVATSAVRAAANRREFVDRVARETGWPVEVIDGQEEARRTLLGIRSGLPQDISSMLALDIGGGSTEFILDRAGQPAKMRSIEIGVVRVTERFLKHDPPTDDELAAARVCVRDAARSVQAEFGGWGTVPFVGTAGTITTLAAMAQRLPAYVGSRIHNYRLTLPVVTDLERDILGRTKAQREGMLGLELGREDVIVAGTVILRTVMETLAFDTCLVSDLGLREGVLLNLAARQRSR